MSTEQVVNYRELLSQPSDSFQRPPSMPAGHYIATIKTHQFDKSSKKATPLVRFLFSPREATSDVDEEALANVDLTEKELRKEFYITPKALWRLNKFLDDVLGPQEGRSFDERIPEVKGVEVQIGVTLRFSDDGEMDFNDVTTVVATA